MRRIDQLLDEYGESHRNPVNKLIHWVAVPVIVWTVIALFWSIPFPASIEATGIPVNWATIMLVFAQLYWFRLSLALGAGLLLFNAALITLTMELETASGFALWQLALAVFVVAWIFQFVGHAIEGKRPSFLKDVQFLLIGPAWLLAFVYRAAGIRY